MSDMDWPTVACSVCGQPLPPLSPTEPQFTIKVSLEHGWYAVAICSKACLEQWGRPA